MVFNSHQLLLQAFSWIGKGNFQTYTFLQSVCFCDEV